MSPPSPHQNICRSHALGKHGSSASSHYERGSAHNEGRPARLRVTYCPTTSTMLQPVFDLFNIRLRHRYIVYLPPLPHADLTNIEFRVHYMEGLALRGDRDEQSGSRTYFFSRRRSRRSDSDLPSDAVLTNKGRANQQWNARFRSFYTPLDARCSRFILSTGRLPPRNNDKIKKHGMTLKLSPSHYHRACGVKRAQESLSALRQDMHPQDGHHQVLSSRNFFPLKPVPAGIRRPMITFSLRPSSLSTAP